MVFLRGVLPRIKSLFLNIIKLDVNVTPWNKKIRKKKGGGGLPLRPLAERLGVLRPLEEKAQDVLGGTWIIFHYAILDVCCPSTCGPPGSPPHKYVIVPTIKIVKQKNSPTPKRGDCQPWIRN
jgi:hypothetical protein